MTQIIEVVARTLGEPPRSGEILETLGDARSPHYRVRWDDGHESVFYPGPGARIRPAGATAPSPAARPIAALRAAGAPFEVIPHERTTTAAAEARALGVRPEAVGKTVIVRADGRRIRVVVPASRRVDPHKLAAAIGTRGSLLTEAELAAEFPDYELGAVPPFDDADDCVVLDTSLAEAPSVILEAGAHDVSLRLAARDLILAAHAQVADVTG